MLPTSSQASRWPVASVANNYDGVPDVAPVTGSGNDMLNVRSNPNDFGAQVGGAIENLGNAGQKFGSVVADYAIKRQGMLNETMATNAESDWAKQAGEIYGKYRSLQGLDAVGATAPTISDIQGLRQKIRDTLPNDAVRRSFDMMAIRRETYLVQDINGYSAGQVKAADTASAAAALGTSVESASRPEIANNDAAFGSALGDIKFQSVRMLDNQGWSSVMHQDPRTGEVTFDPTPDGKNAKAVYDNYVNKANGEAWDRRLSAIAFDPTNPDVRGAVAMLDRYKDKIPADTYAKIAAKLDGPYKNLQTRDFATDLFRTAGQNYDRQIAGQASPSNQGYQGHTVFAPEDFIKDTPGTLAKILGVDPSAVTVTSGPRGTDHNASVHGVNTSEHVPDQGNAWDFSVNGQSATDTATGLAGRLHDSGVKFDQIIDEGGNVHVGFGDRARGQVLQRHGQWPNWTYTELNTPAGNLPKPSGSAASNYVPEADWYEKNSGTMLQNARQQADQRFPNNPEMADAAYNRFEGYLNDKIRIGKQSIRADQNEIGLAIRGKYTNGKPLTDISQLDDLPQTRDLWFRLQQENPYSVPIIQRLLKANSQGPANTYGTKFWSFFQDVASGRVSDPMQLASAVDVTVPNKDKPLTTSGYDSLGQWVDLQKTPEGQAFVKSAYEWLNSPNIRGAVTATGSVPGAYTPKLDAKFETFLMNVLPKIMDGKSRGLTAKQMFDPKSADYVGGSLPVYTQADMMKDLANPQTRPVAPNSPSPQAPVFDPKSDQYKSTNDVVGLYRDKKLTKEQVRMILENHVGQDGWPTANSPVVPTPH